MEKMYTQTHKAKWDLAEKLITNYNEIPIIPLYPHDESSSKAGKVPCISNWSKKEATTVEELETWKNKNYKYNIGLVLGRNSGWVAIDVDGKEGEEILWELSKGDTPDTLEYITPGGGRRLLYKIREENKGKNFRKYTKAYRELDHVECALLGDGQQTVLPYSIHPNRGIYKWVEGKSPEEIQIALMPKWMESLMLSEEQKINSAEDSDKVTNSDGLEILKEYLSKCKRFEELYHEQIEYGLNEEDWFKVIRLLIRASVPDAAKAFSRLSYKHDDRSEERIDLEILESEGKNSGMLRCTSLGCSKEKVLECFGKLNINESNEITNSPGSFIKHKKLTFSEQVANHTQVVENAIQAMIRGNKAAFLMEETLNSLVFLDANSPSDYYNLEEKIKNIAQIPKTELKRRIKQYIKKQEEKELSKKKLSLAQKEQIGIIYDPLTGEFKTINGNKFARHILNNFDLAINKGQSFYEYINGYWNVMEQYQLSRKLRDFFHSHVPDMWSGGIENQYMEPLKRETIDTKYMLDSGNYINVENGLYNLSTFKLEPHNKSIFSVVQIPIKYNPKADCPQFRKFINDIFDNDEELIKLIQEIMGYSVTTETKAHKIFILLGEGSNGKSVFCDIMLALCGKENVSSVPMKDLEKSFARYEIVDKILNISTENEVGSEGLQTQNIKAIASGDPIRVERKFEDGFMYQPMVKLLFAVNRLPYSIDKSYGLFRRLITIPFNKTFSANPQNVTQGKIDINLTEKLLAELDGIFNFAMEGLKRLQENNYQFTVSKKALQVLEEYRLEINPFFEYVAECMVQGNSEDRIDAKLIYQDFIRWCEANNHVGLVKITIKKFLREFRSTLKNANYDFFEKKSNGPNYFHGIIKNIK